ncbi:ABC transporter permease [Ferrimonas marina]|uniref:ABC-type transport system, involved in lipoprotein release, permease component n=1 Tax=Ferrimonas marina TaxID=299255 RepID=A0A1M5YSA5_9GAMM|nr:FtsX-like permease family protein [Ferrimonas marina]SHI14871.1 ABC-type transport system, involved in lipoprotein release, permease component [Ferrimonas marina]
MRASTQLLTLAWRNLWRNKLRTSIMLGAVVFGLIGVVAMIGFIAGLYGNMIQNAIAWQTSQLQVHNQRYLDNPDIQDRLIDPQALLDELAALPQVAAWSERFVAEGMVASARATRGIRINGVQPAEEAAVTPIADAVIEGQWLDDQGRNPVLVSQKTADRLRLKLGSKVVLTFTDGQGDVAGAAFRVRGIFQTPSTAFDDGNLFVRKSDLTALAGLDGSHELAIRLTETDYQAIEPVLRVKQALQAASAPQNRVRDWQEIQPMLASILGQMGISNAIIIGIYVVAMGFGIINIMLMSVFERTREFGVLMAVGMQKHKVFALILLESAWLGICGGLLGVLAGLGLMQILQRTGISLGGMADGLGAFGADTLFYPVVTGQEYGLIFLTVVAASLLAALYPARQILRKRPAEAMAEKH